MDPLGQLRNYIGITSDPGQANTWWLTIVPFAAWGTVAALTLAFVRARPRTMPLPQYRSLRARTICAVSAVAILVCVAISTYRAAWSFYSTNTSALEVFVPTKAPPPMQLSADGHPAPRPTDLQYLVHLFLIEGFGQSRRVIAADTIPLVGPGGGLSFGARYSRSGGTIGVQYLARGLSQPSVNAKNLMPEGEIRVYTSFPAFLDPRGSTTTVPLTANDIARVIWSQEMPNSPLSITPAITRQLSIFYTIERYSAQEPLQKIPVDQIGRAHV